MEKIESHPTSVIFNRPEEASAATGLTTFVNAHQHQLRELYEIENLATTKNEDKMFASDDFTDFANRKKRDAKYIFLPWRNVIVKTIGEQDYYSLISNRNQDLITSTEQNQLRDFKVAVLGLSVGSNIARVLAQAGVSKNMVLSDFDLLDTTNLNRILGGIHQVGTPKINVIAEQILENNPYMSLTYLDEGATISNIEPLLQNKLIDCLIDEVDNLAFKIELRKLAIKYKVPVLMVTDNGDGIVLHLERYENGHDKIFGKDISYWKDNAPKGKLSKQAAGKLIIENIVGGPSRVDPRMIKSVQRVISKELVSWSQLGSAALLGGVASTFLIKQLVRGDLQQNDIRIYLNLPSPPYKTHYD